MSFEKCILFCNNHGHNTDYFYYPQEFPHAPFTLCAILPLAPGNRSSAFYLYCLAFSRVLYSMYKITII